MTEYQGPKIVLTRICVAASGLVIHSVPDHWPAPITDIIQIFQPQIALGQVQTVVCSTFAGLTILPSGEVTDSAAGAADGHPGGVIHLASVLSEEGCG